VHKSFDQVKEIPFIKTKEYLFTQLPLSIINIIDKQAKIENSALGLMALVDCPDLFVGLMQSSNLVSYLKEQTKRECVEHLDQELMLTA
jgi:hypothetical protein